jgi:transposase InsO family protein
VRFFRTMLNESLYAAIYQKSEQRRVALPDGVERYNSRRPHGVLEDRSQWPGYASPTTTSLARTSRARLKTFCDA